MNQYPFTTDKTIRDYYAYHAARQSQEKQTKLASAKSTHETLWNAVFALPFTGVVPRGEPNAFRALLARGIFDLVPLGRVYGTHMLRLIPSLGSLPESES